MFSTAVVTGAASGIGRALATLLAERDASLVLADRDAPAVEAAARCLSALAVTADVSVRADNQHLADIAGAPDLVCLNAGVTGTHPGPVWETPPEEWQQVLDINLGGVFHGLAAFVPRLLATGRPHHLLITASLAGLATWPGGGAYAASKHAVIAIAEQAALSLANSQVSVTVLCPALVRSGMSDVGEDPSDVAAAALAAVEAGRFVVTPAEWRSAVTGRGVRLAAGDQPVLPAPNG